jgi:glutamyl-Q tRNA(Asp) synthetase
MHALNAKNKARLMADMPVFRFAPSPNGALHLGHALSAFVTYDLAQRHGGRFLLRIEDIDVGRCRPEFIDGIYVDLAWLGLRWEEPVLHQSLRFDAYRGAARKLRDMGLLYPCFASRREIAAAADPASRDPDGTLLYPGLHKNLSQEEIADRTAAGEHFALRLDMSAALALASSKSRDRLTFTELDDAWQPAQIDVSPERWGDVVIVRKDVPTSYHLAVVVDDAAQGVTHVTRGQDLFAATDLHRLLQVLLDLPEPKYHHHRLLTDADGRKLAKSAHDTSLCALREDGATLADIRKAVGLA